MRLIKWTLCNGMNGCDLEGEIEVEDGTTDADIESQVREDMWDRLSLTWQEVGR